MQRTTYTYTTDDSQNTKIEESVVLYKLLLFIRIIVTVKPINYRIERDKSKSGSLRLQVSVEAQYATKSPLSQAVTITFKVEHEMPSAGVIRGLEVIMRS